MNLTSEQVQAIREGAHVPIVPPEVGEECIVLRRDAYEKIKHLLYDDGDVDPAIYPLVSAIMAEDDAEDIALESCRSTNDEARRDPPHDWEALTGRQ